MKVTKRSNVFETNSSSMHAIIIDATDGYVDSPIHTDEMEPDEYGWGYDKLDTPYTRLQYLWSAIDMLDGGDDASVSDWRKKLITVLELPEDFKFVLEKEKDVYKHMSRDDQLMDNLNELMSEISEDKLKRT